MIDIDKIRNDTLGCQDKLFFNSAGSSLSPHVVHNKIIEHLEIETNHGGYWASDNRKEEIEKFYIEAAKLINSSPRNIAFAGNASEAFAKALSTIHFNKGDVIITTDDDYTSNYINFLSIQKRSEIKIVTIKNLANGDLDIQHFEELVKKHHPKLVSVTHIPTNSGLIQDVASIGLICSAHDIVYLVDACQSIGQITVDVSKIKCDFLSVTGRKFLRGPRGTGFLYVSDKILDRGLEPLYIELGGAELKNQNQYSSLQSARKYEMWEKPYALILGLTEAIRYASNIGMENIEQYTLGLSNELREGLQCLPNVQVFDRGSKKGAIVTIHISTAKLDDVGHQLDQQQIYYSKSTFDAAPIDYKKKGIEWTIRLSPHYFNTAQEVEKVIGIIEDIG